jgi:uncharacterized repeat protein (TIGR01451 family)
MVFRRMLLGGAAVITVGSGMAWPGLAQAADAPQVPSSAPAQVSAAQQGLMTWTPSLTIRKAHEGPASQAVAYTLWVKNDGTAATNGTYTVVDSLPDGVTYTSADAGQRWSCGADAMRTTVTCRSDASLDPGTTSDPITLHAGIADKDPCQLINITAVGGGEHQGGDSSGIRLSRDVLTLPCHPGGDKGTVNVNVNVTGNNNGGHGGDSTGATANGNGHIHDITGGIAKAQAGAEARAKSRGGRVVSGHRHKCHHIRRHMALRHFGKDW